MNTITDKGALVRTLLTLILLIAFLGQIDIRPFSNDFRFSLGVPVLAFILLYFPTASPVIYSTIAGLVMVILRGVIAFGSTEEITLDLYIFRNMPVMVFYLAFGCLFSLFDVQRRSGRGMHLFFLLLACEILANVAELFVMHVFLSQPLERGVFFVVLIGVLRCGATAAVYRLTIYWQERHDRALHEARYRRMLLFFSNIKTDLLFFRKSMDDIESAMKYSYSLYEKLKGGELGEEALSVSRRIHEVKKEYQRLNASMEKVLSGEYVEEPMRLSDMFSLLQANTETLLATRKLPITVSFTCHGDWMIRHYYTIISIINNLVINAVEAMAGRGGGSIAVNARCEDGFCVLEVADNGPGIAEDLLDCIFEPGFSTKFDPATGEMSTGIGLAHVKSIVENHCDGKITVHSSPEGTLFSIRIPEKSMDGGNGV
ncbi:putative Integral membrane sensor signal transduction histidine kinase [uncultured delta proteobacterium]|uniref:histidine kinase n=1 Tax=uncultured delta proteobacterium TaxID=34034 RepID=A0A212K435_9DELT|nr:putative Integral membrane sensor signal transduction histidine kinase [uncultured delta proteobacterium]